MSRAPDRSRLVDVAARAGVSAQTVSNVFSERGGYTDATKARVMRALKELEYRPDRAAQSLRTARMRQIGLDMSGQQLDVRTPVVVEFVGYLLAAATRVDHQVVLTAGVDGSPDGFADLAARRGVDGFVLFNSTPTDPRPRILADLGVPYVTFGRPAPDLPQTWVDIDNSAAMAPVVDHIVGAGHRHIAYLGDNGPEYWVTERLDGVHARLAHHGRRLPESATFLGRPDSLRPLVERLLARKRRPTAVITSGDQLAALVVNVARGLGLEAGRDITVTGFGGDRVSWMDEPPLTTVRIPVAAVADALVARFLREVETGPTSDPGQLLPTEFFIGRTG